MSNVNLYNVLKRVGATSEEAERAVADIPSSKEILTKADLKNIASRMATKADLKKMGRVIIMWIVSVNAVIIGMLIRVLMNVLK